MISGRPGTGKTTVAKAFARCRRSCYLRVDVVETALARAGVEVGAAGYAVIHELAVSNLLIGVDVVVDAVNAVPEARIGWRAAPERGHAALLQIETWLPDRAEHQRRVDSRTADIPGHQVPSWEQVLGQQWVPWNAERDGPCTRLDTSDSDQALATLLAIAAR